MHCRCFLFLLFLLLPIRSEATPSSTLFIALDGVPYRLMKELKASGYFASFHTPTKIITTFPSTTTSGFSGMFEAIGAGKPEGYDEQYYSKYEEKIMGSLLGGVKHGQSDYRQIFDFYRTTLGSQFMMYLRPAHTAKKDLKQIQKIVWKNAQKPSFYFYIGGTDGMAHIKGEKALRKWLIFFDSWLQTFTTQYQETFHRDLNIVLFSDHGFQFHKLKHISVQKVQKALRKEELFLTNSLKGPHSIVAISWGNISGTSFYLSSPVSAAAHALSEIEGMDLVIYRYEDRIVILSHRKKLERAHVLYNAITKKYAYLPLYGDPLEYQPILKKLRLAHKLDAHGFASERDWFEATADHYYPDAPHRLYAALSGLVKNTASILCSIKPEYEFGGFWTRLGAGLIGGFKGTHGGLFQEASAAFMIVTNTSHHRSQTLRYDEIFEPFIPSFLADEFFPWKDDLEQIVKKDNRGLHRLQHLHVQQQHQADQQQRGAP